MAGVVNRTTFEGVEYVQLEDRPRSLWWRADEPHMTDGVALDTTEIRQQQRWRRDNADVATAEELRNAADTIKVLQHLKSKSVRGGYGSATWFG